jgi:hypothetical protein
MAARSAVLSGGTAARTAAAASTRPAGLGCVGIQWCSASAEGDDAADGIVRGDANGDAVPWDHLDPEAAHPAAQLREYFVALVALHAVKTATVNRHDRALHVNQIVLAQSLSFLIQ